MTSSSPLRVVLGQIRVKKIGLFGLVNALVTFFCDLLEPLGPFLLYVFVACLALTAICWIVLYYPKMRKHLPEEGSEAEGVTDWVVSGVLLGALGAALSGVVLLSQHAAGDPKRGLVAELVPAMGAIQERFGIVEEKLDTAIERLEEIDAKLENVKKETSEDPRKELNNLGVSWTPAAFASALQSGDLRTVSLFLQGGMHPEVLYEGASALLYTFLPGAADPVGTLDLVLESGFPPDKPVLDRRFVDDRVMGNYWSWDHPDLPPGYGNLLQDTPWDKEVQFEGPVLFWLVLRMVWDGSRVTEQHWQLVRLLLDSGASPDLPRAFLERHRVFDDLDDTGTYERLLAVLSNH